MHVAILGNGITGATAALELRKRQPDWRISLISGESSYPYSRPALMYIWMGHMTYQDTKPWEDHVWDDERIARVRDWVTGIDTDAKTLQLHRGGPLAFDRLLLATGSKPNKFGWPGQDLDGVQGLYSLMDLRQLYDSAENCRHAVIVGGGLIGIELAEMLHSRQMHVTLLVRESSYWNSVLPPEESAMVTRAIRDSGIDLRLESELGEIVDDGNGRACAVITKDGTRIDCGIVGLTAGVSPNLDVVKDSGVETGRGILVDRKLRTNVEGIYAAGDCAEFRPPEGETRGQLEQVWYTGKAQAKIAAANIAGAEQTYASATWFNSAKFLDLEYQTYGAVNRRIEGEGNLYWEHENGQIAVRLVHKAGRVIGINVMGTRFRHRVCEAWIEDGAKIDEVLDHLDDALFDPEFYEKYGKRAAAALRSQAREEITT